VAEVAAVDDEDAGPPRGGQRHLGGVAQREREPDAAAGQGVADVAQALEGEGERSGGGVGVVGRQPDDHRHRPTQFGAQRERVRQGGVRAGPLRLLHPVHHRPSADGAPSTSTRRRSGWTRGA
jgi:hypothetical protein